MKSKEKKTETEVVDDNTNNGVEADLRKGFDRYETATGAEAPSQNVIDYEPGGSEVIQFISMEVLTESASNPRKHYDQKKLEELADSIRSKGVVQNLVVRALRDSTTYDGQQEYQIVAGSRRFRAAKIEGLKAVPCVVRDYNDAEVLEIQVIENNQREDVHPLEEGEGYAALLKIEGYTVEAIAGKIGRSDKYVRERLQLAHLVPKAKEYLEKGQIYYTHARLLARLRSDQQEEALKSIWTGGMYNNTEKHPVSVKTLEKWIEHYIEKSLGSAPFPLDDALLVKSAGACNVCPKNTACDGQLFPEYATSKKGVCLDPQCFKSKVKAVGERKIKEKVEAEDAADLVLVSGRRWQNGLKKFKGVEKVVVGYDNWEKSKKGEKDAVQAVIVSSFDANEKGRTTWVKLKNKKDRKPAKDDTKSRPSRGSSEKVLSPEEKAEQERQRKVVEYTNDRMIIRVSEAVVEKCGKKIDKAALGEVIANMIDINSPYELEIRVSGLESKKYRSMGYQQRKAALKKGVMKMKPGEMIMWAACAVEIEDNDFNSLAKKYKVDTTKIEKEIQAEAEKLFPVPKKKEERREESRAGSEGVIDKPARSKSER